MQSIDKKIISRIYGKKRGWVFVPNELRDLGSRQVIDLALHRMVDKGVIRRLARGLYDYPKTHPKLGVLAPSTDAVANALKDRDAARIVPSGAYAANVLGLSEQVPMRIVCLTDGGNRKVELVKRVIELKKTTPKNLATSDLTSGLVIQALRNLGKDHVGDQVIATLRQRLSETDKKRLLKDIVYARAWMGPVFRMVASDEGGTDG